MPEPHPRNPRILIVDSDPVVAESLGDLLRKDRYRIATAHDGVEALAIVDQANGPRDEAEGDDAFALVITDLYLPRMDGFDLLKKLRKHHPSVVPIVVTGYGRIESAVESVKLGAIDYLTKPVIENELRLAVRKAVNQHALLAENKTLRTQLSERFGMGNLVGGDYRIQKVYDLIEAVAPSKTTVLISGESGTGKTMAARAIHGNSNRGRGPFITFACGSIPETLLESELFGHKKGAFTGADYDKAGKIEAADGGTLFIDEINSATPALQVKLLRVLQEKAFEPVGSTQTKTVDVRFVLATNQALDRLVEKGAFREDLYYRINVVNIHMPSLRDRPGDISLLAEHFLARFCAELRKDRRLGEAALSAMQKYSWPGNVRELENVLERAVVLSRSPVIEPHDLPEAIAAGEAMLQLTHSAVNGHAHAHSEGGGTSGGGGGLAIPALSNGWTPTPLEEALRPCERQILLAALEANAWNRTTTADQLGINRTTLYKKIKQYRLDQPDAA